MGPFLTAMAVLLAASHHRSAVSQVASGPLHRDVPLLDSEALQGSVKQMFDHGYQSYMQHAFPHDELKPLTKTFTDSLGELGNLEGLPSSEGYHGVALTLIDSLSTLAVLGERSEFEKGVRWLQEHLTTFDVDVRLNVFEGNIRLLGGLLSAHLLASDERLGPLLMPGGYAGGLLDLAHSLGLRLLPAFFVSPTGLPYAWVNLRSGIRPEAETSESNTAACGSLTLEMGMLSRLTGNPVFEAVAKASLRALWGMRTRLDLLGTSLDVTTARWMHQHGGIGAGADSFYEYLLKAYVLFGDVEYWHMFERAYSAAMRHYRLGQPWYHDSDIRTGQPTQLAFASLQAFWPGLQVLAGDLQAASDSHAAFFWVWQQFGALPERYLYSQGIPHPTEHYYPLRPELLESTFYLHQATRNPVYQHAGAVMLRDLNSNTRTEGGYASVANVVRDGQGRMPLEDHMPSYFLAEACKYLFLLYNDTFLQAGNYLFTTEGHPFPIDAARQPIPTSSQPQGVGNATLATLHTHPFYRENSADWAAAFGMRPDGWQEQQRRHHLREHTRRLASDQGYTGFGADQLLQEAAGQQDNGEAVEAAMQCHSASLVLSEQKDAPYGDVDELTCTGRYIDDLGVHRDSRAALHARQCVNHDDAGPGKVQSLCHVLDRWPDHRCESIADCGVDANMCRQRICSKHGFCRLAILA